MLRLSTPAPYLPSYLNHPPTLSLKTKQKNNIVLINAASVNPLPLLTDQTKKEINEIKSSNTHCSTEKKRKT